MLTGSRRYLLEVSILIATPREGRLRGCVHPRRDADYSRGPAPL